MIEEKLSIKAVQVIPVYPNGKGRKSGISIKTENSESEGKKVKEVKRALPLKRET